METLGGILRSEGYNRGVFATQSERKLRGLDQTINPQDLSVTTEQPNQEKFPLDLINPEKWKKEVDGAVPDAVAKEKTNTLIEHFLPTERPQEKLMFFAVDVVTILAQSEEQLNNDQGYNLARLSRHFDDPSLSADEVAVKQETLAQVERSTMAAVCVNNNFWIEWRVGFSVANDLGQTVTHKIVMRSQFDGLDFMEVQQAFEPSSDSVPAFEVGPRLEFARLARLNKKIAVVMGLEQDEISPEEMMNYVYHCGFPPQVILDAVAFFKAQTESVVN